MTTEIKMRAPAELKPYAKNAKIHDEAQVAKIAASLQKFGWRGNPIVVDENDEILAGHGRRLASIKLGLAKVPVIKMTDMNAEEKRAFRLADNRVAIGNLDTDILSAELVDLNFDMSGFFDKKELDFVIADIGAVNEEAFVTDLDAEIVAQETQTKAQIAAVSEKGVPIAAALGFKSIRGADQRAVVMFMAQIEADTGKTGADALIEFVSQFAGVA